MGAHTEERPCEDTTRRQPSASQGKRSQEKPNLLTSIAYLALLASGTVRKLISNVKPPSLQSLLWQHELINAGSMMHLGISGCSAFLGHKV